MFKYLFASVLALGLTGCLSEDEVLDSVLPDNGVVATAGTYRSTCEHDGTNSTDFILTLTATSRSIQLMDYAGVLDCSIEGVANGAPEDAEIEFSKKELGENISYIKEGSEYVPFHFEDGTLTLGERITDISAGIDSVFSDFASDPEGNLDIIFNLLAD